MNPGMNHLDIPLNKSGLNSRKSSFASYKISNKSDRSMMSVSNRSKKSINIKSVDLGSIEDIINDMASPNASLLKITQSILQKKRKTKVKLRKQDSIKKPKIENTQNTKKFILRK